jgi:membrane protease YdiL (CAAX protease family)
MISGVLSPLFFEATPKSNQDYSDRIAGKAILAGASVYVLFGPMIAAIAVVVHLAFSFFSEDRLHGSWFAHNLLLKEMNEASQFIFPILKVNMIFGLFVKLTKTGGVHQIPLRMLLRSFYETPFRFLRIFSRITIIAPVVEEVVFRGYLQEKIRDVQTFLLGNAANGTISKIVRVVIQALVFAFCHFHPLQGLSNVPILMGTFLFGFYAGMQKEKKGTLWTNMTIHGSINTIVCLRVIFLGG